MRYLWAGVLHFIPKPTLSNKPKAQQKNANLSTKSTAMIHTFRCTCPSWASELMPRWASFLARKRSCNSFLFRFFSFISGNGLTNFENAFRFSFFVHGFSPFSVLAILLVLNAKKSVVFESSRHQDLLHVIVSRCTNLPVSPPWRPMFSRVG